jgi:hypothetical protein
VDEARTVLARLERIDELEARGAPPGALLAEVRVLLAEAEEWLEVETWLELEPVGVEPVGTQRAAAALTRCHAAFTARAAQREVVMM